MVIIHFFLRFVTPFAVFIGVIFAQKAGRKTTHYGQDPDIQRYVLPKFLNWFNTPDEDGFPLYEPTVKKIYDKFGWRVCMFYNLGLRNQAQGFLWLSGQEVPARVRELTLSQQEFYGVTTGTVNLGFFKVHFGWETAHDHYRTHTDSGLYAIPDISFSK